MTSAGVEQAVVKVQAETAGKVQIFFCRVQFKTRNLEQPLTQMQENPYHQDREEMKELLKLYQDLKNGKQHSFLEEEAFERIIDYFDDTEDLAQAIEAVETGIEQYPYSSSLMVKKADLMIATRRYH